MFFCSRKTVSTMIYIKFYSRSMIYHCRYSLLPALSLNGIIHAKIVKGSFTTTLFHDFIEGLLDHMQPFPAPNSVIVMDNARIHKHPHIVELIEEQYVQTLSILDMFSNLLY